MSARVLVPRRLRYGLRALFVATAAAALVASWHSQARQQRDAIGALRRSNPGAAILYEVHRGPGRWEDWRNVDYFSNVDAIELSYATDAELRLVSRFRKLAALRLLRAVDITDEGLSHLRALGNLKKLAIEDAVNVGDRGLTHIAGLADLEELAIGAGMRVTRAGVVRLARLHKLRRLEIACCSNEAARAVDELARLLPNCRITRPDRGDIL